MKLITDEPGDKQLLKARLRRQLTPFWADITVVLILILIGLAALSNQVKVTDTKGWEEMRTKSNLHNIQLALERYSIDHGGQYPSYLIGGQGKYSEFVERGADAFPSEYDCPDPSALADPLLREGYIEAYPKNPFVKNGLKVYDFQGSANDPLRDGTNDAKIHGTRFGPKCNLMGNVMADVRFTQFTVNDATGVEHTYPTFADVEFPCSDIWKSARHRPFLSGQFFYRVLPEKVLVGDTAREEIRNYMLGAYGGPRIKGKDIMGPDPTGVNKVSPCAPDAQGVMAYGNPNGTRDGVVLVLVPGEDVNEYVKDLLALDKNEPPKPKAESR